MRVFQDIYMSLMSFGKSFWLVLMVAGIVIPPPSTHAQNSGSLPPAPRKSSIILIVADGVSVSDLGCYGGTKIKTPNLDRLASEGAKFTSFYGGSVQDGPSRASLMLGKHTGHLGIRDESSVASLGSSDTAFSQLLTVAGYKNAMIGKWGLSDGASGLPKNKGFEEFAGFLDNVSSEAAYPEFIHRYQPNILDGTFEGRMQLHKNVNSKRDYYVADMLAEFSQNFIRISKPDQFNKHRPFFLMLGYPMPHPNDTLTFPEARAFAKNDWPQTEKNRAAAIARLDASVGRVLDALQGRGVETNTIVIFTSSAPKVSQSTNALTEAALRVPFIVRWPQRLKPTVVSTPWAMWDIFPTVADIARTKSPDGIDGISFYPTLQGHAQANTHDFLYWEYHDTESGSQQAARMGKWKAVRLQPDSALKLYDLEADSAEKQDVAGKNATVVAEFEKRLKESRTNAERWPLKKVVESSRK
jgi:arylsulfatase A-like enzyme